MIDKIKLILLSIVVILTAYNTYQISTIEVPEKKYIPPAPLSNNNSLSNKNIDQNNQAQIINNPLAPDFKKDKSGPTTSIKFENDIMDFGNVEVNSENKHSFNFINTGSEPLIISKASGSCGCTVPFWPKEPIMPGKKGTIDIIFTPNSKQAGISQQKTVTVTANTNPENTILNIKAFVNSDK